ncbi:hypothetical protein JCM10295v2_002295 [Rhodotorula toruloides]
MAGAPARWPAIAVAKVEEEQWRESHSDNRRNSLAWLRAGDSGLAVLALAWQSNSRHQAQRFRLIHSAPSSFVYIFSLGNHGRPSRILRCHAPTAVRWRSHRTLSFSVRAVVDAFKQSR